MPIEFRCTHCNRLLRTPDETSGKQAQCPECGAITTIPSASTAGPLGMAPPPGAPGGGPFPPDAFPAGQPAAFGVPLGPLAPEQPQEAAYTAARAYAAGRVAVPATALIVISILALVLQAIQFVRLALNGVNAALFPAMQQAFPQLAKVPAEAIIVGAVIGGAISLAIYLVILFGALSMKRLNSYTFSLVAAILAILPCTTPCCLGLPFGIWALVVLNSPPVREAFRS